MIIFAKLKQIGLIWGFIFIMPGLLFSQEFVRISATYSIKIKKTNEISQLSIGKVYYDVNFDKIVYQNKFPNKDLWITKDTVSVQVIDGKVVRSVSNLSLNKQTVFYLALKGELNSFGLAKSLFTIEKVVKEKDLVITTWKTPAGYSNFISKILVSNKNNQLYGVVVFGGDQTVLSKQFFRKYELVGGVLFPTEIIQITYTPDNKEIYQMTNYKDLQINDFKSSYMYDFPVVF